MTIRKFESGHRWIAAAMLAGATSLAVAQGLSVNVGPDAGVPHLSGGVGKESRAEINALSSEYRLRVVDAIKGGAFTAGVHVRLKDERGDVVLDTKTDGPILLANPPAGEYTLVSSYEGQSQSRKITVPASGQKRVDMRWDEPPEKPKTRVEGNMQTEIVIP